MLSLLHFWVARQVNTGCALNESWIFDSFSISLVHSVKSLWKSLSNVWFVSLSFFSFFVRMYLYFVFYFSWKLLVKLYICLQFSFSWENLASTLVVNTATPPLLSTLCPFTQTSTSKMPWVLFYDFFLYSVLSLIVVFSMHHCDYLPSINIFMIFIMIYHANYLDHVDHHYHHDLVIMIIITIIIKRVVIISTSSTKSPAFTSRPGMDSRELLRFNVGCMSFDADVLVLMFLR